MDQYQELDKLYFKDSVSNVKFQFRIVSEHENNCEIIRVVTSYIKKEDTNLMRCLDLNILLNVFDIYW